jgi:antirestriction protein ArdC
MVTTVVYYGQSTKEEPDPATGEAKDKAFGFLKQYTVFNGEQCEGLPPHYYALKEAPKNLSERLQGAEDFVAKTGAQVRHGGNQAYFSPSADIVVMPNYETFKDRESYYSTLAHELTHWTGSEKRLNRDLKKGKFGNDDYAMEELVAELGAAYLAADLGITPEPRPDHAAYMNNWLKVLKQDKKAIFTAAAAAEKAVEYLHGLNAKREQQPERQIA